MVSRDERDVQQSGPRKEKEVQCTRRVACLPAFMYTTDMISPRACHATHEGYSTLPSSWEAFGDSPMSCSSRPPVFAEWTYLLLWLSSICRNICELPCILARSIPYADLVLAGPFQLGLGASGYLSSYNFPKVHHRKKTGKTHPTCFVIERFSSNVHPPAKSHRVTNCA